MSVRSIRLVRWIALLSAASVAWAAAPPDRVHYQGVLRDAADEPLDDSFDMVFRFYDAEVAGSEILVDTHDAANGNPVAVTGGLFDVDLGSGALADGAGPGVYTSLSAVFRDHGDVWVAIEVGGETLSPRVAVAAAPYAHNASNLDGRPASDFIDTSSASQVKSGDLTVDGLMIDDVGSLHHINGSKLILESYAPHELALQAGVTSISLLSGSGINYRANTHRFENFAGDRVGFFDSVGNFRASGNAKVEGGTLDLGTAGEFLSHDGLQFLLTDQAIVQGSLYVDDQFGFNNSGQWLAWDAGRDRLHFSNDLKLNAGFLEGRDAGNFEVISKSSLHLVGDNNVRTMVDDDSTSSTTVAAWYHDGQFNTTKQLAELQEDGDFRIGGTLSQNVAFDVAETFLASEPLQPGDVVRFDPHRPGAVLKTGVADDTLVLGVVSERPGVVLGSAPFGPGALREIWGDDVAADYARQRERLGDEIRAAHPELDDDPERIEGLCLERFFLERFVPVALVGRVPVKVDAGYGQIRVGDLLTPSPTPGYAMRTLDPVPGTVIGKAMEALDVGTGRILVMVTLR